jgi:predicted AlkP superfamily phosphohydrolase/phosphomutase
MKPHRVLLVGWDAADWKVLKPLIDRREMPVFGKIVERGVISDMATLEPVLSPMLWNCDRQAGRSTRNSGFHRG